MTPTVSVVMAAHNVADVVDEAIAAIVAQRDVDWELIAVDDGSEDATLDALRRWEADLGPVRMHVRSTTRRRGSAHARNIAITAARGEYLAIADADDVSLPHRLARTVDVLADDPSVAAVGGQVAHFWADHGPRPLWRFPTTRLELEAAIREHRMPLAHPATTFRTAAVRAVGGYDEDLLRAQDLDLMLRLARRYRLVGLDETLVHYRRNPRLVSMSTFFRNQLYAAYVRDRHRRAKHGRPVPLPEAWLARQRRNPLQLGWLALRYVKQLAVPS